MQVRNPMKLLSKTLQQVYEHLLIETLIEVLQQLVLEESKFKYCRRIVSTELLASSAYPFYNPRNNNNHIFTEKPSEVRRYRVAMWMKTSNRYFCTKLCVNVRKNHDLLLFLHFFVFRIFHTTNKKEDIVNKKLFSIMQFLDRWMRLRWIFE